MKLETYFKKMSEYAADAERRGDRETAQDIRDERNEGWARGSRSEVRYQQAMSRRRR